MKHTIVVKTPPLSQPERNQHAWESARKEIGLKLYGLLMQERLPAVIDIEEEHLVRDNPYGEYEPNEFRITVTISPVQHRHVEILHYDYVRGKLNWAQKVKKFLKNIHSKINSALAEIYDMSGRQEL